MALWIDTMKNFIKEVKKKAANNPKIIVYPEGGEERILVALKQVLKQKLAIPILLGNKTEILKKLERYGIHRDKVAIIQPDQSKNFDHYCEEFVKLRKHKGMTLAKAKKILRDVNYFGTMMVYMGDADCLLSGAVHTTAATVRPALQIIKTHEQYHRASALFLLKLNSKVYLFADVGISIDPTAEELAEIAIDSEKTAKRFGIKPKVAMLSFSTHGSAHHPQVEKVKKATEIVKKRYPKLQIDGELQLDAALIPEVRKRKAPGSKLKGEANVLIFPDLNSGNICVKIVERLAKAKALGTLVQGLHKPINDLSRGCTAEDIVNTTALTVVEAQGHQ